MSSCYQCGGIGRVNRTRTFVYAYSTVRWTDYYCPNPACRFEYRSAFDNRKRRAQPTWGVPRKEMR